jgi:G3E family GTPase
MADRGIYVRTTSWAGLAEEAGGAYKDADGLLKYPSLGHTTKVQIESADLLLLNKIDLVSGMDLLPLEGKLRQVNTPAPPQEQRVGHALVRSAAGTHLFQGC